MNKNKNVWLAILNHMIVGHELYKLDKRTAARKLVELLRKDGHKASCYFEDGEAYLVIYFDSEYVNYLTFVVTDDITVVPQR